MTRNTTGHIMAFITIFIWGTTFISTKILLEKFQPIEILFFRFVIGFLILYIVSPHRLKLQSKKQNWVFAGAGITGICFYYLLENIALTYTMASNVGVIISTAPFFTAILSHIIMKGEEKLGISFFIGFVIAMIGICMMTFQEKTIQAHFIGDLLALIASFVWACYAILTKKISSYGYPTIQTTRYTFLYGILFMIPALFIFPFEWNLERFLTIKYTLHILFLAIGASALCFVTWAKAVSLLGAVKTSVYIYIVPIVTVITSAIVLKEKITFMTILGTAFTLLGLLLSEKRNS